MAPAVIPSFAVFRFFGTRYTEAPSSLAFYGTEGEQDVARRHGSVNWGRSGGCTLYTTKYPLESVQHTQKARYGHKACGAKHII